MRVQRIHTLNQRSPFQIASPSGGEKKVLLSLGFINMDQVGSKSKKLLNRHTQKVGKNAKQSLIFLYFKCRPEGNKTEKRKAIHDYHLKTRTFENLHKFQKEGSYLNQMNNQHPFKRSFLNLSARRWTPYLSRSLFGVHIWQACTVLSLHFGDQINHQTFF